jgi:iron-sulfur cluster assembly protein
MAHFAELGENNVVLQVIVVDNKDLPILDNIEIDYVRQGLNEGFEFNNPLEKDRCGCGESFRI